MLELLTDSATRIGWWPTLALINITLVTTAGIAFGFFKRMPALDNFKYIIAPGILLSLIIAATAAFAVLSTHPSEATVHQSGIKSQGIARIVDTKTIDNIQTGNQEIRLTLETSEDTLIYQAPIDPEKDIDYQLFDTVEYVNHTTERLNFLGPTDPGEDHITIIRILGGKDYVTTPAVERGI